MSFFLTGTDTGVGKTTTAALLMSSFPELMYWKPVQSGSPSDREKVQIFLNLPNSSDRFIEEGYSLEASLSPHRAAQLESISIDPKYLLSIWEKRQNDGNFIIEGSGGLLVPLNLNPSYTWIDFLIDTKLPVLIASRTSLGTINHSLLTVRVLQEHKIPIIGFVFCGKENLDNQNTVQHLSGVQVIGQYEQKDDVQLSSCPIHLHQSLEPWIG